SWNVYALSTFTIGSSRRAALTASRSRVNAFSFARSALRAASHSSRPTTALFAPPGPFVLVFSFVSRVLVVIVGSVVRVHVAPRRGRRRGRRVICVFGTRPRSNIRDAIGAPGRV